MYITLTQKMLIKFNYMLYTDLDFGDIAMSKTDSCSWTYMLGGGVKKKLDNCITWL